jgi:hypothetical protein
MMNGQKHPGTIESERSNALERIVENGHGTVTFTFQKRKKHCICNFIKLHVITRKSLNSF